MSLAPPLLSLVPKRCWSCASRGSSTSARASHCAWPRPGGGDFPTARCPRLALDAATVNGLPLGIHPGGLGYDSDEESGWRPEPDFCAAPEFTFSGPSLEQPDHLEFVLRDRSGVLRLTLATGDRSPELQIVAPSDRHLTLGETALVKLLPPPDATPHPQTGLYATFHAGESVSLIAETEWLDGLLAVTFRPGADLGGATAVEGTLGVKHSGWMLPEVTTCDGVSECDVDIEQCLGRAFADLHVVLQAPTE